VPLLLTRARDGEVRVFLNVCRHRGARLVLPQGEVCRRQVLACPYHSWTYRLDGSLAGVPRGEVFAGLDRDRLGLVRLPAAERHGLLWAMLDRHCELPDIAAHLGELDREFAALGVAGYRCYRQHALTRAANWKLIVDAFLEVYHVTRLHSGTIGRFFTDAVSVGDALGRHLRYLVARADTAASLAVLPPEAWSPQRHATLVHYVFPNSIFVYHPDYISHLGLFPNAADETLFVHTMLIPEEPQDDKAQAHWQRSFALMDDAVFNAEDLAVCEAIQRGLASGANEALTLGGLERNLVHFHAAVEAAL
jgi:phenylpropionate dioxygenase-like ring-hydroxylating dioxygenase large terminal subunit